MVKYVEAIKYVGSILKAKHTVATIFDGSVIILIQRLSEGKYFLLVTNYKIHFRLLLKIGQEYHYHRTALRFRYKLLFKTVVV